MKCYRRQRYLKYSKLYIKYELQAIIPCYTSHVILLRHIQINGDKMLKVDHSPSKYCYEIQYSLF